MVKHPVRLGVEKAARCSPFHIAVGLKEEVARFVVAIAKRVRSTYRP